MARGREASEAPNTRISGSINAMPPTHSTTPMTTESPMMVVTVRLAPSSSLAPTCRPARTAAPAAKMFSMDTMMRSSGTVTPTAVKAISESSIPM